MEHEVRETAGAPAWQMRALQAVVIAAPLAYSLRFTSFDLPKVAVILLGFCAFALIGVRHKQDLTAGCAAYLPLVLFGAWALAHAAILDGTGAGAHQPSPLAPIPARALPQALYRALPFVAVLSFAIWAYPLLDSESRRMKLRRALIASGSAVAALGLLQYARLIPWLMPEFEGYTQRIYSVFGNQDLFGGYLALCLPLALHEAWRARRRPHAMLAQAALMLAGLLLSGARSAWLAAFAGAAFAMPWRSLWTRRTAFIAAACLVVAALSAALAPQRTIQRAAHTFEPNDAGARLRLWFWEGALDMARAGHGWGWGSFTYHSPRFLGDALRRWPWRMHNELHAEHAHCEPLEIAAETSLIGLAFWVWWLHRLAKRKGPEWGGLAALALFALFNGVLHSHAHLLAGLLLAGNLLARDPPQSPPCKHKAPALCCLWPFACTAAFAAFILVPSYWLQAAEDAAAKGPGSPALYARAAQWPCPFQGRAWEGKGIVLARQTRYAEAERCFKQALRTRDTGSVYLGLAIAACAQGHMEQAKHWAYGCLRRWPTNRDAWEVLWRASEPHARPRIIRDAQKRGVPLPPHHESRAVTGSSTP